MSYKALSSILKILGDSSRLEIIDLLSCGELCACDLLEYFKFSQPTLSHHMKLLINHDLVSSRKEGNKRMYNLNHDILKAVIDNLNTIHFADASCVCKNIQSGECL